MLQPKLRTWQRKQLLQYDLAWQYEAEKGSQGEQEQKQVPVPEEVMQHDENGHDHLKQSWWWKER